MVATALATTDVMTVGDIIKAYPGRCGRLHPSTVGRWISKGYPLTNGTKVRLKATRLGSRWLIAPADWTEFLAALTAAHIVDNGTPDAPRSPAARSRAAAAAGDGLTRLGV